MADARVLTLLLVDDDALIRAGLAAILGSAPGLRVIGEAENGVRGLELASRLDPDVILMDIRMPQLDGLSALEELIARDPAAKVIILTTFGEEEYIDRAMAHGASGFML
ncbi:DNA-binding response regulator, partial [Escherichia coli]|nr:DNA-binding response regulator [Escherichia coli]